MCRSVVISPKADAQQRGGDWQGRDGAPDTPLVARGVAGIRAPFAGQSAGRRSTERGTDEAFSFLFTFRTQPFVCVWACCINQVIWKFTTIFERKGPFPRETDGQAVKIKMDCLSSYLTNCI